MRSTLPLLRVCGGLALLGAISALLDWPALLQILAQVNVWFFLLGLFSATLANLLCALRWTNIATGLGIGANPRQCVALYGQGIAISSVVPGGIIGGDAWRAAQLESSAPLTTRLRSVFLDRLSGLWALCLLGLAGSVIVILGRTSALNHQWLETLGLGPILYILAMGLAIFIPVFQRLGGGKALALSVASQAFTVLGFWLCMRALNAPLGLDQLAFVSVAIFLAAMIPASVGGFGAREGASIFFLGFLGISAEIATAGSILFGLTATIQGLAALLLWSMPKGGDEGSEGRQRV